MLITYPGAHGKCGLQERSCAQALEKCLQMHPSCRSYQLWELGKLIHLCLSFSISMRDYLAYFLWLL